ncbi:hypothetical protein HTV80_14665 [Streptomyces sp. Vc74B-19]|uniref:hypothetical protein n=1 Tax=Streptomyces sp. Vc74B-19 TaxID=2741324 RepID=UPI001BFBF83F|nr:hypothetical protein [Streptomyces sp. Vc74B-19]MBT3164348.1 hypothetical protein [Streptomyces sp. Vc74B-19]
MNRRPALLALLTLSTALTLTACGSDDTDAPAKGSDRATEVEKSASPATTAAPASDGRPTIELPDDLSYTFDWPKTGDKEKDAVLADSEQSIKAVDQAIVNQDALDKAYLYYYEGEAAAITEQFIEAYVEARARITGEYRYYDAVARVSGGTTASLVYCEDQSKAFDMYLKDEKVNRTPVSKKSYVLYNTQLRKNDKDVWVITKLLSERGSDQCQP